MRISDWSSDVCSSDLASHAGAVASPTQRRTAALLRRGHEWRLRIIPRSFQSRFSRAPTPRPGWQESCSDLRHERRSEEHTSELQSLMRISYAVFCLKNSIPIAHVTIRDYR